KPTRPSKPRPPPRAGTEDASWQSPRSRCERVGSPSGCSSRRTVAERRIGMESGAVLAGRLAQRRERGLNARPDRVLTTPRLSGLLPGNDLTWKPVAALEHKLAPLPYHVELRHYLQ